MDAKTSSRPHWLGRLENKADAVVARLLKRRGWVPRVEPYTGYGLAVRASSKPGPHDTGWVRVMGRVLLAPSHRSEAFSVTQEQAASGSPGLARPRIPEQLHAERGWRNFLTAQLPGAEVFVTIDGRTHALKADRGGYLDVVLPAQFAEGWHEVDIAPVGGPVTTAAVRVIGRDVRTGLVSDVDDTVMVTALPRPLIAIWNLLVRREDARRPVPGMADLYAEIGDLEDHLPVVYLSTNAWNLAAVIRRFLAFYGLPAGPLLLTDWGPTNSGWFRSGREHKLRSLERLAVELPDVRWILVGDDGQHDPLIYSRFAQLYPDHVKGVAIRQLSAAQQVLSHGGTGPSARARTGLDAGAGAATPFVAAPDGAGLARQLRAVGLLPGDRAAS